MAKPAAAALVVVALLSACGATPATGGRPRVVAALYPLAYVASQIAGGHADVSDLTPAGVEPHDLELTAGQVAAIEDAGLVVFVDHGFQPAVEASVADAEDRALDVLSVTRPRPATGDAAEQGLGADPHVWLDPKRMQAVAGAIARGLGRLDRAHAGAYRRGAAALERRLADLDRAYSSGLAHCARHDLVTSHEAFGYLARRYGLVQVGITGIDPEAEPSPQRIAEITQFVRDHHVTTIFFESLLSPRIARTIAAETGARAGVLDPLESHPARGDYFAAMRSNLRSLREALGCV